MRETEKNVRWLRDINPRAFSWWAGRRDLKNYSLLVFQEVAQLMNAILGTVAGLKYKVGHENLLFGLRMFFFFLFRVGRGLG